MQAGEFGFDDFCKMLAVAGVDLFPRPSRYFCCGILSIDPPPDEGCDEFAKLFAVAKPEGIRLPKGLANAPGLNAATAWSPPLATKCASALTNQIVTRSITPSDVRCFRDNRSRTASSK